MKNVGKVFELKVHTPECCLHGSAGRQLPSTCSIEAKPSNPRPTPPPGSC